MTKVFLLVRKVHNRVTKSKARFHNGHTTTRNNKNLRFTRRLKTTVGLCRDVNKATKYKAKANVLLLTAY